MELRGRLQGYFQYLGWANETFAKRRRIPSRSLSQTHIFKVKNFMISSRLSTSIETTVYLPGTLFHLFGEKKPAVAFLWEVKNSPAIYLTRCQSFKWMEIVKINPSDSY